MKTPSARLPRCGALAVSAALLPLVLVAAPAPATPGGTAPPDEAVELSPFVVSTLTEKGYAATNTLDGSRLNTALRDTPAAISVFTRDFLDDIGATNMEEILRYDISAEISKGDADPGGAGAQANMFGDQGLSYRSRGLTGGTSINGFQTAVESNTYNVERVGATRGPNAILFGTGAPGGVLNFRTRQPSATRNLTLLEFKVAGESTKRVAIDLNRVLLKDKLGLRVMATRDRKGSPQPHQYQDFQGITVAANYQFRRDTSLTVSYVRDHNEGVSGRDWNHVDGISRFVTALGAGQLRWNPTLERYENANGTALVAATAGTGNVSNRTALIYGPDLRVAPQLWEGATAAANRITLSTNASIFNFDSTQPIVDERFEKYGSVTSSGPGEFAGVSTDNLTAIFNHRLLPHLFMELAYNLNHRRSDTTLGQNPLIAADLNYRLPDGTVNPYFYGNGYYYSQQNFLRLKRGNDNETMRASFSYEKDLGPHWGQHRLAVMAERNVNHNSRLRSREVWANRPYNPSAENAANQVFRRRYFQIGGPSANYTSGFQPGNPTHLESYTSGFATVGRLTTDWAAANGLDFDDKLTTDTQMAVMQNYFFNRRLVTTAGIRGDTIRAIGPRTLRDPATGKFRYATASDQATFTPLQRDWFSTAKETGVRKSVGAVLHLTPNYSLIANYATGVGLQERNRSSLPEDETPPPTKGVSRDFGFAFSFLDNRISGSIKRYDSKSLGERIQGGAPVFVNPNNDVMTSFDYYFRQAGLTTFGANDPIKNISDLTSIYQSSADSYLSDQISKGTEIEIVANLTRNWTLRASYSHTNRVVANTFFEALPWWADRIKLWKSLDTLYTQRTGRPSIYNQPLFTTAQTFSAVTVAQRIAESDTLLADSRLSDERGYGNRPDKANFFTRYQFSTGRLKGLAIGGGWRYQSANVAGVHLPTGRTLWGNPRSLGDLFFQYKTRGLAGMWVNATSVTYQLNVTNFLDDRTINATKLDLDTVTGVQFYRRAYRESPRVFAFTLRLEF
jgi:outer membrane receptor protein involved in Fe transport